MKTCGTCIYWKKWDHKSSSGKWGDCTYFKVNPIILPKAFSIESIFFAESDPMEKDHDGHECELWKEIMPDANAQTSAPPRSGD